MRISSKLWIMLLALLLLAMPLMTACDDDETTEPPTAPVAEPTAPVAEPTAPVAEPTAPVAEPTAPVTEPTAPVTEPVVEELKIKIGSLTDKTGQAAQALINVDQALKDNIEYFTEQGLFPEGLTVELMEYDTSYNQANFIPGYEYLREQGADIIVSSVPGSGEVLKSRVDEDGTVFFMLMATPPLYTPPGYIFSVNINSEAIMYTLLDWVEENDPNFPTDRPAKLGGLGAADPYVTGWIEGLNKYCENNANWEMEDTFVVDWTTMTFTPEIDALKDCDYIIPPTTGFAIPNFITEFRQAGHTATFLGSDAAIAYLGMIIDGAGWDIMDGMYFCLPYTWYTDDAEVIDIINYVFENYHSESEVGGLMWSGGAYRGGFTQWRGVMLLIQEFLEENGLAAYNTDAFYEYLQSASIEIDGNVWDYSETDRQSWNSMGMLQADAATEGLVRVDDGWFPVVFEP
ncbi:MAG: ABC transporter substrate-binding protein [Chloroflexi bacterium]|nr:ABC transporter substrate-binding protein [Chloroflexota bacterium]